MIDPKYLKDLTPPRALLDQCYQVLLPDSEEPIWLIKKWARAHCQSFVWAELIDISDASYDYDSVSAFYFGKEADKIMFALKWK
jgi:hypothetical protein